MKKLIFIGCALMLLSSCRSLTPFTQDLYEDLSLAESDVKSLQFYLSQDIVLIKSRRGSDAKIQDGKIRMAKKAKVDRVVFRAGTPGMVVFLPKEDRFAVSFGEDDKKFLMFGPNRARDDRYTLLGKEWDNSFGTVTYDGEEYETSTRNALASLMVDVNKVQRVQVRSEEAKGRRIK